MHGAEPTSRRRSKVVFILVAVLSVAGGMVSATQWIAHQYAYQLPEAIPLGEVWGYALQGSGVAGLVIAALLLRLPARRRYSFTALILSAYPLALSLGEVYPPHLFAEWIFRSGFDAWVTQQAAYGFSAGAVLTFIGFLPAAFESKPKPSTSAGSAHWGDGEELKRPKAKWPGRSTYLIGRKDGDFLHYGGPKHLLTIAGNRTGKGTGSVIPNLLFYPGGVVCNDPRGENLAVTRRFRTRKLRQECVALDPFDVMGGTAGFNPLDPLDSSSLDWLDDARHIADMIVTGEPGNGTSPHWNREAKAFLSGFILYVTKKYDEGPQRSLTEVRRLITLPGGEFKSLLNEMQSLGGLVARAANRHLQKHAREATSIVSSAQGHTHFLDSTRMVGVLEETTFDLSALSRGELSLYIILPPKRNATYKGWRRLMLGSALYSQMAPPKPENNVLFLFDEAAQFGHMQLIEDTVSIAAGYGITLWFFYQNIGQIKTDYKTNWQTIMGNAGVTQVFQNQDPETQKYISELAGDTTLFQQSESQSRSMEGLDRRRGTNTSLSETGRPLLKNDEVRRMEIDRQTLFVDNLPPIEAEKLYYLEDPEFEGLYDPNPLH